MLVEQVCQPGEKVGGMPAEQQNRHILLLQVYRGDISTATAIEDRLHYFGISNIPRREDFNTKQRKY